MRPYTHESETDLQLHPEKYWQNVLLRSMYYVARGCRDGSSGGGAGGGSGIGRQDMPLRHRAEAITWVCQNRKLDAQHLAAHRIVIDRVVQQNGGSLIDEPLLDAVIKLRAAHAVRITTRNFQRFIDVKVGKA